MKRRSDVISLQQDQPLCADSAGKAGDRPGSPDGERSPQPASAERPARPSGPAQVATLFYDADCGLCRWAAAKVAAWDRDGAVRLVPLQDRAASDRFLGDMDEETRMASWHLVTADGVHSAGRGVAPLFERLPGGTLPARLAAGLQPLTDVVYRFVADHRSGLGRLLSRRARDRADRQLRRRASPT